MKLTNVVRDGMASEILRHRFSDEIEAHIRDKQSFASEVYCDIYSKSVRERMDALPAGWLVEGTALNAQFGASSSYDTVYFTGHIDSTLRKCRKKSNDRPDTIFRRIFQKHRTGCAKVYPADHRLCIRREALIATEKDLRTRIAAAEVQVDAALASVTTMPALLKAWPEVEPFAKHWFSMPAKLPAIPASELNKMFKLPIAKAA